jgi:hypothetical protein
MLLSWPIVVAIDHIMRPRMILYLVLCCCFHATRNELKEGLADIKCCCHSHFAVVVAIVQHGILTSCAHSIFEGWNGNAVP